MRLIRNQYKIRDLNDEHLKKKCKYATFIIIERRKSVNILLCENSVQDEIKFKMMTMFLKRCEYSIFIIIGEEKA